MRLDPTEHRAHPWEVHDLAGDFDLLDVWRFPLVGGAGELPRFLALMTQMEGSIASSSAPTRALFALRKGIGRVLGWDRERVPLSIPGCSERSVRARLREGVDVTAPRSDGAFHPVYLRDREALLEISNGTVHALMHLGWVEQEPGRFFPEMAVYVKHRGALGRIYMALIAPFRHALVYPSLMKSAARRWGRGTDGVREVVAPAGAGA
jgi:hypothetical protein